MARFVVRIPSAFLGECRALARIATPLIMASITSMGISFTDVVMVGRLGTSELAAGAAVSDFYSLLFYLAAGVITAMSPLLAQAMGRNDPTTVRTLARHGFILALLLAIPGALIVMHVDRVLAFIGIEQAIIHLAVPYAEMMAISYVAMTAAHAMHCFLSAHGKTRSIMLITLAALPLNALGDYLFIFGGAGLAPMGLAGAGLASAITTSFTFGALALRAVILGRTRGYRLLRGPLDFNIEQLTGLLRLGVPIGVSNLGMIGVFMLSTVTIGVFGPDVLAAHTVALRVAGLVFAVPSGFAQAATVRVGHAAGAQDFAAVRLSARTALALSITAGMIVTGVLMTINGGIVHTFLGASAPVSALVQSSAFLFLVAIVQPFNNLGVVGAGVLRGLKDTRAPMLASLAAFWGISFTGGWSLAFLFGLAASGIWVGLTGGNIAYGLMIWLRLRTQFSRTFAQSKVSLAS